MLKIGEFSRLSRVTVKTLHHYDEMGLLKPSHTDPFTGYRYYTLDQLPRLHTIVALKELGLSLDEIGQLLLDDLSAEQIRGMYRLKQAELQQRVRDEQARLAQVEFRLRQLELEDTAPALDIVVKRIEPLFALTLRRIFRTRQEREVVAKGIEEAIAKGIMHWSGGVPTAIFYEEEFRGDYFDTEMVVPVDASHPPVVSLGDVGTFTLRELPAIETAAVYMHQGDYDSLTQTYLRLQRWAVANGYHLSGTWRFLYHRGPMHRGDPEEYLTEIQHQLDPAPSRAMPTNRRSAEQPEDTGESDVRRQ
jgi:DNA-binding transcriptional MerR regulator